MARPEFHGSKARLGMHDALRELTDIYLLAPFPVNASRLAVAP